MVIGGISHLHITRYNEEEMNSITSVRKMNLNTLLIPDDFFEAMERVKIGTIYLPAMFRAKQNIQIIQRFFLPHLEK